MQFLQPAACQRIPEPFHISSLIAVTDSIRITCGTLHLHVSYLITLIPGSVEPRQTQYRQQFRSTDTLDRLESRLPFTPERFLNLSGA